MNDNAKQIALHTQAMIEAGRMFHSRGWVPATGGNFSVKLSSDQVLITASGWHKGELAADGFLVAGLDGKPLDATRKASYETLLHMQLYQHDSKIGAALHTHSIANTVLSRRHSKIRLAGYELLKLLPGINTHDAEVSVPVFANDQDIARLAAHVDEHMKQHPETPAYLIAGHGLYAWGANVAQARHRVEALEFMFECELWSEKK
ncbi:methylthioribulose 1-phosphate dehydratase [Stenotrophobium rhamnosiphilum]|uniref:Methylthioribulose-1-phosphate dehydratase n=1 Tax=Stenotrophobium rhamnosiphilum TaxID=2029166 RepID=A0A2T5MGI4_9GAMM|nr:methylthioribulose 1-phosphate dehydratase [Stenotrophobium rhamnosiphilum]PTU31686.1 methylthioribulose 1-phosphate dehydratase [Stenotrophobium rhamnosiphilum]